MPSVISHYLLAGRMLARLRETHPDFKVNQNALYWGAQGPDFLYASPEKKLREAADLLHRGDPYQTLSFITSYAQDTKNDTDKSYALGFLAHYALDSAAHPFVLYGAGQIAAPDAGLTESIAHSLIEVTLDVILLRYERSDLPGSVRLVSCAPKDETVTQHMAVLYPMLARAAIQKELTLDQVSESTKAYQKWLKKHTDRTGLKKDFILRREKKKRCAPYSSVMYRSITEDDTYDYANIANNEWDDGEGFRTDSFFDLFEQADTLSKEMADAFLSGGDAAALSNGKPFIKEKGENKNG